MFAGIYRVWQVLVGGLLVLGCYFLGTWLSTLAALPLPGALLGLVILLVLLFSFPTLETVLTIAAKPFLTHMSVLFIPAVLSVSFYWGDIQQHALAITIAIVITTCISLGMCALITNKLFASSVASGRQQAIDKKVQRSAEPPDKAS